MHHFRGMQSVLLARGMTCKTIQYDHNWCSHSHSFFTVLYVKLIKHNVTEQGLLIPVFPNVETPEEQITKPKTIMSWIRCVESSENRTGSQDWS